MEKRVWLTSVDDGLQVTKTEPVSIGLNVEVMVRPSEGAIPFDGVWLNGERSYDTHVLVDGVATYNSPVEDLAEQSFEMHEAAGGGRLL
jgi:hypothetical protein